MDMHIFRSCQRDLQNFKLIRLAVRGIVQTMYWPPIYVLPGSIEIGFNLEKWQKSFWDGSIKHQQHILKDFKNAPSA